MQFFFCEGLACPREVFSFCTHLYQKPQGQRKVQQKTGTHSVDPFKLPLGGCFSLMAYVARQRSHTQMHNARRTLSQNDYNTWKCATHGPQNMNTKLWILNYYWCVKGARGYSEMILQKMLYKHGTELLQHMEMRHMRITKYEHSKHEPATNTMEKPKTSREKFLSHLLAGPPPAKPLVSRSPTSR